MEEKNRKEIAKESLKALNEIEEMFKLEDVIKDNKIEFSIKNVKYRVRKPNSDERKEIETVRRKKHLEFMSDDSYLFKQQWIEKYKKKGIDIDKKDTEIRNLQKEVEGLLLKLAKTKVPKDIETLKKEIIKKRDKQYEISIEKTDLLSYSIEDQLLVFVNSYTTYLVLERLDKDEWVKVFNSYEDFQNSEDSELITRAFYYMNTLIYRV